MSLGVCHAVCVRRFSLDGEGNALYPVLSSCPLSLHFNFWVSESSPMYALSRNNFGHVAHTCVLSQ